jgi:hypothetical protein
MKTALMVACLGVGLGVGLRAWAQAVEPSSGASSGASGGPTLEELREQVRVLQMKVEEMGAKQVSRADVDAIIREVLADSAVRSKLFGAGLTAGYEEGFFIRSEDGSFSFRPTVIGQFRYIGSYAEGEKAGGGDSFESGFEFRRLRVRFDGNVFSKDVTYGVQWENARGASTLLDAWGAYRFAEVWRVKGGQFTPVFSPEEYLSPALVTAVDKTLVHQMLGNNIDRVQGVELQYGGVKGADGKEMPVRVTVAAHDGANSINTDFRDSEKGNFGFVGRAEWLAAGRWADTRDWSPRTLGESDALLLGAGADYSDFPGYAQTLMYADVMYKSVRKFALYGGLEGMLTEERNATGDRDRFDSGVIGQFSFLPARAWEPFVRYSYLRLDEPGGDDGYSEIVVGVNRYLGPDGKWFHRAKVVADVVYLPDGAPGGTTALGYQENDEAQVVFRVQLTLQI